MLARPLALVLLVLGAGCVGTPPEATADVEFRAVPGHAAGYALRVLNATQGNVTFEATAPSVNDTFHERSAEADFRRTGRTDFFVLLPSVQTGEKGPSVVPTWTIRVEGLRATTYSFRAEFQHELCERPDVCRSLATAQVLNYVTVTEP